MQSNTLVNLITSSEEFRKQYIGYKTRVEHRDIPLLLVRRLPSEVAMELLVTFEREKESSHNKKT